MIPKNNTVNELDYIKNIDETYFSKALRNAIINNKKIKSLYLNVKTKQIGIRNVFGYCITIDYTNKSRILKPVEIVRIAQESYPKILQTLLTQQDLDSITTVPMFIKCKSFLTLLEYTEYEFTTMQFLYYNKKIQCLDGSLQEYLMNQKNYSSKSTKLSLFTLYLITNNLEYAINLVQDDKKKFYKDLINFIVRINSNKKYIKLLTEPDKKLLLDQLNMIINQYTDDPFINQNIKNFDELINFYHQLHNTSSSKTIMNENSNQYFILNNENSNQLSNNNLIIDIRNKNISSFTKEELHQFYIDLYQFMREFKQLLIMNKKIVQINTIIVFVYQHDFKENLQEYINFIINNTENNDYVVNFLNQIYINETL